MQRTKPDDDSEYYLFTFEDDNLYGTVGVSMIPCYRITVKATSVLNGRMQYEAVAFAEGTAPLHRPKGYSFLAVNPLGFVQK